MWFWISCITWMGFTLHSVRISVLSAYVTSRTSTSVNWWKSAFSSKHVLKLHHCPVKLWHIIFGEWMIDHYHVISKGSILLYLSWELTWMCAIMCNINVLLYLLSYSLYLGHALHVLLKNDRLGVYQHFKNAWIDLYFIFIFMREPFLVKKYT